VLDLVGGLRAGMRVGRAAAAVSWRSMRWETPTMRASKGGKGQRKSREGGKEENVQLLSPSDMNVGAGRVARGFVVAGFSVCDLLTPGLAGEACFLLRVLFPSDDVDSNVSTRLATL
jgi:hypothetical protein